MRCQLKSGGGSGGLARVTSLDIFYAIVARAPNLRHLLFAFPDELVSAPWVFTVYEPPPVVMPYLVSSSSRIAAARLPTHPFVPLQTVFSRLTSLRIYHHREGGGGRGLTLTRILADCMLGNITELTALRTLELCCDFINYWPLADLQFPPLPQLHHLRLYGSPIHEPRLVALLLPCVNLESLLVHFEHACDDELDRVELPDGKTLDDALLAISATLTSLELVALDWHGHYLTRGRERPRKRENHRLKCLPQLARVHQLTIDWRSLFGTLGIIDNDDSDRFPSDLFPAALRELTLVCEFGTYKDFKQRHLSNLDAVFMGIEQMCATGAPAGLERVTLAMDPWPKKSRFAARFRRTMVRAGEACAAKGISLRTCDLLPRYRDEDDDEEIGGPEIAEGRGDDGPNRDTDESPEEQYDATSHEDGGGQHTSGCATVAGPADTGGGIVVLPAPWEDGAGAGAEELEEEDEASDYYYSTGDDEADPEREALRPADFGEFMEHLGEGHGHTFDELYYAWHEDRWDEYLF